MKIIENKMVFAFDGNNKCVAEVEDGETLVFRTHDCFDNQLSEEGSSIGSLNWDCINPATGPVYVKNAVAGDVLKVEILDIKLEKQGVMCALPDNGVLGSLVKEESVKRLKVEDNKVYFNENIVFDVNPMIGVIGVAPKSGAINCGTPGNHGGNMDNKRIAKGATLYFPVFHDGAIFSLGDVHAAMGDGEIMVSGVEISADVTVRLSVIKGVSIETPIFAQTAIATFTLSAVAIAAIPIPLSDAVLLSPLEIGEINSLAKIYGIKNDKNSKRFLNSVVEAGTVGVAAKAAINSLKAIPAINLAASVINAAVAGAIVLGIGEVCVYTYEQIYLGNKSLDDVDWINKIIELKLNKQIIEKINMIVTDEDFRNGNITNLKKLFAKLLSK